MGNINNWEVLHLRVLSERKAMRAAGEQPAGIVLAQTEWDGIRDFHDRGHIRRPDLLGIHTKIAGLSVLVVDAWNYPSTVASDAWEHAQKLATHNAEQTIPVNTL